MNHWLAILGSGKEPTPRMKKTREMVGQVFGKLTVLRRAPGAPGRTMWLCQCECGRQHVTRGTRLRTGATKSCGCAKIKVRGGDGQFKRPA